MAVTCSVYSHSPLVVVILFLPPPFPYQVVTNRETQETLLALAYVFEVSANETGSKHRVYRLVKSPTNA